MAKTQYLFQRKNTWYMRVRIPKDLLVLYKSQREIVKTLETKDYDVARSKISMEKALIEVEFEKKRKKLADQAKSEDVLSQYARHELIALVTSWMANIKADAEERRRKSNDIWTEDEKRDHYDELRQEELLAREEMLGTSSRDAHDGMTIAASLLKEEGIGFNPKSDNFRALGGLFTNAIHQLSQERLREWEGKRPTKVDPFDGQSSGNGFKPEKPVALVALFDEYMNDPSVKRGQSTRNNYKIIFRALEEVIGKDTLVHTITRAQCRQVKDLIYRLPSHTTKRTKGVSLTQAAEIAGQKKWPKMAPATFNMYMHKFSALMGYAQRELYIQINPALGLTIKDNVKKKDKRDPFTMEQLNKIFSSPLYTGCVDDGQGYNKPGPNKPRGHRFWLPLIGLYSGMRMNEICQLRVEDVYMDEGCHLMRVEECLDEEEKEEGEVKSVKTVASTRTVPVHPELLKMGFIEHVERIRGEGHKRVFPELKLDSRGYYSGESSKFFSRHLNNIGAKTKRTSFHSFRHNYRDALREVDTPHEVAMKLGGWTDGLVSSHYGNKMSTDKLVKHSSMVAYPKIDLSHLYVKA